MNYYFIKKAFLLSNVFLLLACTEENHLVNTSVDSELAKENLNLNRKLGSNDLIWSNERPISLNFKAASTKCLKTVINSPVSGHTTSPLVQKQAMQIVSFKDLTFDALLPVAPFANGFVPKSGIILGDAYYFPYLTSPNETNFYESVGNVKVKIEPNKADPRYVFTGEMQGCCIIITRGSSKTTFRAWHFPSPSSYARQYAAFKSKFKGSIVAEIKYSDYGGDVLKGEMEAFNYLFYNDADKKWELSCIPLSRSVNLKPEFIAIWKGNPIATSSKKRIKIPLDFTKIIE